MLGAPLVRPVIARSGPDRLTKPGLNTIFLDVKPKECDTTTARANVMPAREGSVACDDGRLTPDIVANLRRRREGVDPFYSPRCGTSSS